MRPSRFPVLGGLALCAALWSCGSPPAIAPSLSSFSVAPSSVASGVPTMVTWSFAFDNTPKPAPSCTIDGLGPVTDGQQTSLTLSADTTFTLRCSNSGGESTKDAQVTVIPPGAPQIASFTATPGSAVVGTPTDVTWTWTYANTPAPAPSCSINGNVGAVASGATTSVTLAATTTFTLTCTNAAGTGTADVSITANAPGAPSISTFRTIPSSVISGAATVVQWMWTYSVVPTPAPTCTIDHGVGTVANGSFNTVTQTANTTYTLTCTNTAGTASATTTISVAGAPVAPAIATFVATPSSVFAGAPTSVQWKWSYSNTPTPAPTCSIDQGVGTVANPDTTTVTQTVDTTYTLTCTNSGGGATKQVTITATPAVAPALSTFTATPSSVISGTSTGITWAWTYGNSPSPAPTCSIDQGIGTVTSGTSANVTITTDTVYTLTCTNAGGSSTRQVTVTVAPPQAAPAIATFTASPSAVQSGVATNVQWSWTYSNTPNPADSCSIDQGVGAVTNGQVTSVNLTAARTYTLTCTNSVGSGSMPTTITIAPVNTITNGTFENKKLTPWTRAGTTSVATGGHTGTYSAQVGGTAATTGDSSISQTFTASTGATAVSFWYQVVCLDVVDFDWATATLTDNSTGGTTTILAPVCSDTGAWQQVTAPVTAGTSYTLTLISHDDGLLSDPTYTLYDDVTLQ